MIPKIIHQTYKNENLPQMYKECQETIKYLHPDFEYRFYTDDDMLNFIKISFPDYYNKFIELPRMIMKIDMLRYFLMYKFGGIYADLDYKFVKKFDLLDYKIVLPISRVKNDNKMDCLGNCIFASEPNHPFWKMVIDELLGFKLKNVITDNDVIHITGPVFLTNIYKKYTNKDDIYTCPIMFFHPGNKVNNESYGHHLCSAVWRNNQL